LKITFGNWCMAYWLERLPSNLTHLVKPKDLKCPSKHKNDFWKCCLWRLVLTVCNARHSVIIISKNIAMWAKLFLKFGSGVLFNFVLFYLQNFSWRQQRKFHLKRNWSKEHEVYHLQWISLFRNSSW